MEMEMSRRNEWGGRPGPALQLMDEQGRQRAVVASGQRLRLGRGAENDVVVGDDQVSRRHAILWQQQDRYYVRDEGSTNGTWLNGRRVVGSQSVRAGDRLRVGNKTFVLTEGQRRQPRVTRGRTGIPLPATLAGAGLLMLLLLFVLVLSRPSGVVVHPPPQLASYSSPLERARSRALKATVALIVRNERTGQRTSGSGSIVSPDGHILTNFHIIGDPDTGQPYNAAAWALVGVNRSSSLGAPPDFDYIAELVRADVDLDLALLQVIALDGGDPLPAGFNLTSVPIGDSRVVQIGDPISIIGFPELGGMTVTLTKGTVAGFHDQGMHAQAWIKTDTEIGPGNSGGMALNERWELIGVPTFITASQEVSGKIGWIRPIHLAEPWLR
jgi:V8-like Glu-specific endopeptidase